MPLRSEHSLLTGHTRRALCRIWENETGKSLDNLEINYGLTISTRIKIVSQHAIHWKIVFAASTIDLTKMPSFETDAL